MTKPSPSVSCCWTTCLTAECCKNLTSPKSCLTQWTTGECNRSFQLHRYSKSWFVAQIIFVQNYLSFPVVWAQEFSGKVERFSFFFFYLKEMYKNLQHDKVIINVWDRKQVSESQWKLHMCTGCSFSLFLSLTLSLSCLSLQPLWSISKPSSRESRYLSRKQWVRHVVAALIPRFLTLVNSSQSYP